MGRLLPTLFFLLFCLTTIQASQFEFDFEYRFTLVVHPQERGKTIRVWFPIPKSDSHQTIEVIDIQSPFPLTRHIDSTYGNGIGFFQSERSRPGRYPLVMKLRCSRLEWITRVDVDDPGVPFPSAYQRVYARFLANQKWTQIDSQISQFAATAVGNGRGVAGQGRAIYDFVLDFMQYDKSVPGYGMGSTRYACDVKKGNCTDFHALFNAMVRAIGIPSKFQIGFPLKPTGSEVSGYHCWAFFMEPSVGWVPVDISEADKHIEKKDYFFGNLDPYRITFSEGREFNLSPRQQGEPVNFLIYPYVEVEGVPREIDEKSFLFKPL